jgi:hypothetical protein
VTNIVISVVERGGSVSRELVSVNEKYFKSK